MLIHSALLLWALIQVIIPGSQTRPQPTQCKDVNWSDIRNACIKGNNYKTYTTSTIDICKEKCVEEDDIKCQSIEYSSAHQLCSLSEARSDSDDFIEPCFIDGWEFADIELNTDVCVDISPNCISDACVDISPNCANNTFQCDTNLYVQERCKKSCNLCDSSKCPMPECQSPWFRLGSECFLLVNEKEEYRNWTSARTYCGDQAEGADLAQPEDLNALADYMLDNGYATLSWGETSFGCLQGHTDKLFNNTPSFEDCKKACVEERDFICRSADYFPRDQECRLSYQTSASKDFEELCARHHEENLFADILSDVNWSDIRNACIKGNNYKTYTTSTIDICKEKCVEEEDIKCQSIEYNSAHQLCSLSEARSDSDDFIKPCFVDGWEFADIELNTALSWDETSFGCLQGHTDKLLNNTPSFEDCKKACVEERDFECKSADYFPRNQECRLSYQTSASKNYEEPCARHHKENLFADILFDAGYWLGGSDLATEGEWSWINGDIIDSGWRKDEPSHHNGEDCLEKRPEYGANSLNDWTCRGNASFVCERH